MSRGQGPHAEVFVSCGEVSVAPYTGFHVTHAAIYCFGRTSALRTNRFLRGFSQCGVIGSKQVSVAIVARDFVLW
jgi:hypothetical protein